MMFISDRGLLLDADSNRLGRKMPSGMSLIEVLAAMVILFIGFLAAVGLQTASMKGSSRSNNLTMATFLAESQAEWVQAQEVGVLLTMASNTQEFAPNGEPCPAPGTDAFCMKVTTDVVSGSPTTLSAEVTITVEWRDPEGLHSISYETLATDIGF